MSEDNCPKCGGVVDWTQLMAWGCKRCGDNELASLPRLLAAKDDQIGAMMGKVEAVTVELITLKELVKKLLLMWPLDGQEANIPPYIIKELCRLVGVDSKEIISE
jgi:hypothetical protein